MYGDDLPHLTNGAASSRGGFTLIELLAVITVIALLLGLTIPAVQAGREAMRAAQCKANLRQLGIALNSYESVHNVFPPNSLITRGRQYRVSSASSFVFLLSFLEQHDLFNSINCDILTFESIETPLIENRTARNTRLGLLLCPSDGEVNHLNSYRFNRGLLQRGGFTGPFGGGALPKPATITDGLSNTAFLSERIAGSFVPGLNDPRRDIKHPVGSGGFPSDPAFISYCLSAKVDEWRHTAGWFWFYSNVYDTTYNHYGTPNDLRPTCTGQRGGSRAFNPARSFHRTSVNVLYGDGRVESVADSIETRVWQSLGTHSAGD